MEGTKLLLYVLCRTAASEKRWRERAHQHPDLEVKPLFPVSSAAETIRSLAASAGGPFLVSPDEIWVGIGISGQVSILIKELDERFPNWALCGNRGARWDGQQIYNYTYAMDASGLRTATCPHPVTCLDDGLLLVNPGRFSSHTHLSPALKSLRAGIPLSLECLENHSILAVSPRLMVMRSHSDRSEGEPAMEADAEFANYYRKRFLNHYFQTPDGILNLSEIVDYRYLSDPGSAQEDVLNLFDGSLEQARRGRKPSLTICCRTQFRRPELLERAVLSFAVARHYAGALADFRVKLITDQPPAVAEPEWCRLREQYPGASLGCWYHEIREGRHSRTDLLLAAIEKAESDYIWFVDDDDFVNAPAVPAIARSLAPGTPVLLIGSSQVLRETWRPVAATVGGDGSTLELIHAERASEYPAGQILRVFQGLNVIPICSMILPVGLVRQRLRRVQALGNYNEDYFILLKALTSPRVELCVLNTEIACVSLRGEENTVAQKDMSGWHLSLATFLLELMNDSEGNSPVLWDLANQPKW